MSSSAANSYERRPALRFGLHVPNLGVGGDARALAELAELAEGAGWDGFFVWDHIHGNADWRHPMVDPWIALSSIAVSTERIRIGPMVTALARRRPWKVARETASLDHLSGGRLTLGVGLGWPADAEFEHFGENGDARRRARVLDEGLEILAGLWSGRPYAFEGQEFRMRETVFLPQPVQKPRPPVWVAAHWPNRAPLRRAARWDGVFPERPDGQLLRPEDLADLVGYVRSEQEHAGPFDVVVAGRSGQVGSAALLALHGAGATWWLESIASGASLADVRGLTKDGPPRV